MGTSSSKPTADSKPERRPLRVGVLGAGPAGLAVANALERYADSAVEVHLIDKNSSVSDYEGVEYIIQDQACRALERIGIKDGALKNGNGIDELCFYDERRDVKQMSAKQDPKYSYEVYRRQFLQDFEDQLRSTHWHRSTLVTGISFNPSGEVNVHTQLKSDHNAGERLSFDIVIACEGTHSPTRRVLFPNEAAINEYDFHILYMLVEGKEGEQMPEHFHEIANGSYIQFNMGHLATNAFFPLGSNMIAIAIVYNQASHKKICEELGIDHKLPWSAHDAETKKKIATVFANNTTVFDNLFTKLLDHIPDWHSSGIYAWTMRDSDPLKVPYSADGNVILIGDACHAMLPTVGQGASLAIEDGEILARYLADFAKSDWNPDTLRADLKQRVFGPYHNARKAVWVDLITRARKAVPNFNNQQKATGFLVSPYIPIPAVAFVFAVGEWFRDVLALFHC